MAIYRLLKFSAFQPEEITCMTAAYEDALRVLQLADRQDPITELVAKKIIEAADTPHCTGRRATRFAECEVLRELVREAPRPITPARAT
jgi:hypothetical protein